jgi:hypothetical protein
MADLPLMLSTSTNPRFDAGPLLSKWVTALPDDVRTWAAARLWIFAVRGRETQGGFIVSLETEAKRAARIQAAAGVPLVPDGPDLFILYLSPIDDDAESCRDFYHEVAHAYLAHHESATQRAQLPAIYGVEIEADRAADAWLRASGLYDDDGAA